MAHGDTSQGWDLALKDNIEFWMHGTDFNSKPHVPDPPAIPSNEWTHLAITFDGFAKRIYVNGVEAASQAESGPLAYNPTAPVPLTIGSDRLGNALFNGRIDEVALYDRALAADEILDIYNADFLGKAQPYILPLQLPLGGVRAEYPPQQLVTILGALGSKTFSLSEGRLPPFMNLSPTGLISGTPQMAGSFSFTVRATDASRAFNERAFELQVFP